MDMFPPLHGSLLKAGLRSGGGSGWESDSGWRPQVAWERI